MTHTQKFSNPSNYSFTNSDKISNSQEKPRTIHSPFERTDNSNRQRANSIQNRLWNAAHIFFNNHKVAQWQGWSSWRRRTSRRWPLQKKARIVQVERPLECEAGSFRSCEAWMLTMHWSATFFMVWLFFDWICCCLVLVPVLWPRFVDSYGVFAVFFIDFYRFWIEIVFEFLLFKFCVLSM